MSDESGSNAAGFDREVNQENVKKPCTNHVELKKDEPSDSFIIFQ